MNDSRADHKLRMSDAKLLDQFVQAFEKFDDILLSAKDVIPPGLLATPDDSTVAQQKWRPAANSTDPSALGELYATLPDRFPPLYEQFVLTYRWRDVYLDGFLRLFASPPESSLASLLTKITADPVFVDVLFPQGLIPFGLAPDNYDPICFDTRRRQRDGDTPIVGCEHETILCDLKVGQRWDVAPSFRALVEDVVRRAKAT